VIALLGKILKHPVTVLSGAGLGLYVGATFPDFTAAIAPFGNLYLSMLQMVALPIILCAVISGLGSLLHSGLVGATMKRFGLLLVMGPLFAAGLGLLGGILIEPGKNLPEDAQSVFGQMMVSNADSGDAVELDNESGSFWMFASQIVPDNIFVSLVGGQTLQVLFFSILLGIALGMERKKGNEAMLSIMQAVFDSLLRIIDWLIYLLPFGLFALLASQAEDINMSSLLAMLKLAMVYAITCLILFLICTVLISRRTGVSFGGVLSSLRESLMIAAGSSNSFAALPSALHSLQHNLNLDRRITDLMAPLALSLLPLATIIYFAVAALFIAQISGIDLTMGEYTMLFFGSILAGLAASSLPSAAGVAVIAIVLEPLGLPVEVAIVLLIAIDPILDPINAAVDIHVASTATTLVADPPTSVELIDETDGTLIT